MPTTTERTHAPAANKAVTKGAASPVVRLSGEVHSTLINLSGRRRFTSQRVVLYAVLAMQGRSDALAVSGEALRVFREAHVALVEGSAALPGLYCDELHEAYFGRDGADAVVRGFIADAEQALAAIEAGARSAPALLERLVESATPLLAVLNKLTQVYEDLARSHASTVRKHLGTVMSDIESIAKQARIVAFNAQVIAARAGTSGREFAVVSAELSRITAGLDDLMREALRSSVA